MQKSTFPFLAALLTSVLMACAASAGQESSGPENPEPRAGRLATPAASACDRNHLTSWFGKVSGYRREHEEVWLEVSTDYDTVEEINLDYGPQSAAPPQFQLWGETFTDSDWAVIERSPGVLNEGMRVVVWICENGQTPPLVDWRPPRD